MATNVSEKDKTLNEIIEWCKCLNLLKLMYGITDKEIHNRVVAKTLRLSKRMEEAQ